MKKTEHKEKCRFVHVNENLSRDEQIAERAHEVWQQRNGEHGNDLADWLRAEQEIDGRHQSLFGNFSETPREGTRPTLLPRESICLVGPVPSPGGFPNRLSD